MKNIFLSIALAITLYASAQKPVDSVRVINQYLLQNNPAWQNKKTDTTKLTRKAVVQEIPLAKAMDILIDITGDLIIHTWNENKIKIETTIQYEGQNELTDAQWLDKLGVSMKTFGNSIRIKSKTQNSYTLSGFGSLRRSNMLAVFYGNGSILDRLTGDLPAVNLYVPSESNLEIDGEHGFLAIKNDIKSLSLNNNNCQVEAANIDRLRLGGKQGSFNGGTINDGDIQLWHGRLSLKQLNKGTLTSNYSTIEIESLIDAKLSSSNDEVDIDNASVLYGIKNYGNLRINQLTGKLDLQGINSDIKLRHISPSAQLVKISNRNADLRLPSNDLSNFSVDIRGSYNTVYSSFSERTTVDTLSAEEIESIKTATNSAASMGTAVTLGTYLNTTTGTTFTKIPAIVQTVGVGRPSSNLKYSAKIGSGSNPLKYEIICTSCVIDFK